MHFRLGFLGFRILTALSLALYIAGTILLLLLLAFNPVLSIVLFCTSIFLVYAVWLLVTDATSRSYMGFVFTVLGTVALAAEVIYFLSDNRNRSTFVLVFLLLAAYVVLAILVRKRYWRYKRSLAETGRTVPRFQHPYLIINPKAGNGRAVKANIERLAQQQGIETYVTHKGDDVGALAEKAALAGADVIGVSGGDGSIGAAAKVAIEHDIPLVVLPGGTRCHFARDIGLDPGRITDALAGFKGVERRVDVADINGRIVLNNASFGLYADIVDHPEYREHKAQVIRQVVRSIVNGSKPPYALRFQHNDQRFTQAVQVLVAVNCYTTMNLLELGRRSQLDQGTLQVTVVTHLTNTTVRRLLRSVSLEAGRTAHSIPGLHQWTTRQFEIAGPGKMLVVGVDGEREIYASPVTLRVLPGALRLYVPSEGARNRPQPALSPGAAKRLWYVTRHGV